MEIKDLEKIIKIIEKSRTINEKYGQGQRELTARFQAMSDILNEFSPENFTPTP